MLYCQEIETTKKKNERLRKINIRVSSQGLEKTVLESSEKMSFFKIVWIVLINHGEPRMAFVNV